MASNHKTKPVKTLALFDHKDGVGKTKLSINMADTMIDDGLRVLIIDADPQCNTGPLPDHGRWVRPLQSRYYGHLRRTRRFAMLIKVYRAATEGEHRSSPAEVQFVEVVPVNQWAAMKLWHTSYNFCRVTRAGTRHPRWKRELPITCGRLQKC